jgi:hypothetical protein
MTDFFNPERDGVISPAPVDSAAQRDSYQRVLEDEAAFL